MIRVEYCKPESKLLGSVLMLCLASCAALPKTASLPQVYLTDRARYQLLPPVAIEKPLDCAQQIRGTWGGDEFVMQAWVTAGTAGIDIEFYNGFGTAMGNVSFNNEGVFFDSPVFPRSFRGEYLAADFQFCFYRAAALTAALKKCSLVFESFHQTDDGKNASVRRILDGDNVIIEIVTKGKTVQYTNFLRGYSFVLTEAE